MRIRRIQSTLVSAFVSARISRPIEALRRSMQEVEKVRDLIEQNRKEGEQKRLLELRALQAQINPHFLYNTLDSIVRMVELGENEYLGIVRVSGEREGAFMGADRLEALRRTLAAPGYDAFADSGRTPPWAGKRSSPYSRLPGRLTHSGPRSATGSSRVRRTSTSMYLCARRATRSTSTSRSRS